MIRVSLMDTFPRSIREEWLQEFEKEFSERSDLARYCMIFSDVDKAIEQVIATEIRRLLEAVASNKGARIVAADIKQKVRQLLMDKEWWQPDSIEWRVR